MLDALKQIQDLIKEGESHGFYLPSWFHAKLLAILDDSKREAKLNESLKQKIMEKYAINAYAVRNEVSQRCTEKAIQNPNATKQEAEMMEHLIFEQLNYVRIKDVFAVLDEATMRKSNYERHLDY